MVVLDRLQVEAPVLPTATRLRAAIVLGFQDHRRLGPEELRPSGMEVGILAGLHEDAVVAERQPLFHGILHHFIGACGLRPTHVVVGHQERSMEALLCRSICRFTVAGAIGR